MSEEWAYRRADHRVKYEQAHRRRVQRRVFSKERKETRRFPIKILLLPLVGMTLYTSAVYTHRPLSYLQISA